MVLILHSHFFTGSSSLLLSRSSSSPAAAAQYVSTTTTALSVTTPISRLHMKPPPIHNAAIHHPYCFNAACVRAPSIFKQRVSIIVKVSSGIDGTVPDGGEAPSSSEAVPVENLPLESKLQLKLEQKLRMKLAKKIRLRRKRLVRKRQMRKKGRWPPSKVKKNKNV